MVSSTIEEVDVVSPKKSVVSARNVVVKFGPVVALNNFSADVPPGIVGLLGPNGAGKSTFIKTVLGLVNPETGDIWVAGRNPAEDIMGVRDGIGYMPEHDCLIESMNSVELVSYMGMISGMLSNDAMQRTHEVLDFVGIGEERYRPISSYSTGMKQKVKLAQAIVHDPDILFLDEPTNGMDPQGREEMLDLVSCIGESGKTILVSTHLLHEIEKIGEHVIIIHQGMMIRRGRIKDILGGGEGRYALTVRGSPQSLDAFSSGISGRCVMLSELDEANQSTFKVADLEDTGCVFSIAQSCGVQVRSIRPDIMTLEDVFVETFRGGDNHGR